MSDLIVLGLIPGTQIQITFVAWTIIASILIAYYVTRGLNRTQTFRGWLIASTIMIAVQRRQF